MSWKPAILWINLESIRFDHTSLSGYRRETTPNLRRIAESNKGVSFERCFAHSHWTAPSCSSILTGTYPARHGVGVTADPNDGIPGTLRTVPELLSKVGYYTAGLTGNGYSGPASGLDRGFDKYTFFRTGNIHRTLGVRAVLKYLSRIRSHGGGLTPRTDVHGASFMMTDVLKKWVDELSARPEPFFLWTHFGDTHHPYTPPRMFLDRFTDEISMSAEEAREFSIYVHEHLYELIADGCEFSDDEWDALEAMYDAEIAYTDHCIGRLFKHVQSCNIDDVAIVVTGDHGELFGERDLISHKLALNDATTHVPLVTHGLDGVAHQAENIVQHIDVVKTLLSEVGADTAQCQGIDLRNDERDFAVSERSGHTADYTEHNESFDLDRFHTAPLVSLRTEEFRYQQSTEGSELFELPDEETNVAESNPEVTKEMETKLAEWREANAGVAEDHGYALDQEMKSHLEDMGYRV